MSEPVGADLPEARDGEGQLSKDALRPPALSVAPEHLRGSCQPGSICGGRFTGIQNKEGPLLRPSVRSDIFNLWIGYLDPRVSGE